MLDHAVNGKCEDSGSTHVLGGGVALEIWLNGLVLLVEVGKIGDKILDDVGVRQRVDARFALGIGGDTACIG